MNQLDFYKKYCKLLLITLILTVFGVDVFAQTRQKLEEERTKALLDIEETSRILSETQQNQRQSLDRLNLLNAQVLQFKRLIGSIANEIAFTERQMNEISARVRQMNKEIDKMKEEYAQLIHYTYKNRGQYNKLIYVLSAKDFNEAYRRMKYFQQYSEYRKKQVAEIRVKQEEMRKVIEQLAAKKVEKEKLLAEQQKESRRLDAVKIEQDREVNSLKSQEKKLLAQLTTQRANAENLQSKIQKLITAEFNKNSIKATNNSDRLTPADRLISNSFKGNKGRLPWPTERGTVTGYFGTNPHSLFKNLMVPNNGIDITTVGGAEVRAIYDGEVTDIFGVIGSDLSVLVRHGNYITAYSNLVEVKVKIGDKIKSKQTIGRVYTEKGTNSAVLHFEIWEDTGKGDPQKLNPELWISRN